MDEQLQSASMRAAPNWSWRQGMTSGPTIVAQSASCESRGRRRSRRRTLTGHNVLGGMWGVLGEAGQRGDIAEAGLERREGLLEILRAARGHTDVFRGHGGIALGGRPRRPPWEEIAAADEIRPGEEPREAGRHARGGHGLVVHGARHHGRGVAGFAALAAHPAGTAHDLCCVFRGRARGNRRHKPKPPYWATASARCRVSRPRGCHCSVRDAPTRAGWRAGSP